MYKVTIETNQQTRQNNIGSAPLLSQLYIKLPKPQSTPRKPIVSSPYLDEEWDSTAQYQLLPKQNDHSNYLSIKNDSNCFVFSDTRTKNSSASLPFRSESQIITDWVRALFQKKGLLGPHWQQKFRTKRKKQLQQGFGLLKELTQGQCSAYLQTQSHCKPQTKRINKLLALGFDKLLQILPQTINKNKQMAFSRILRFIAFQHVSIKANKDQQNPINSAKNSLKSSKNNILNSKFSKQIDTNNKNGYSPYNIQSYQQIFFKNQDYDTPKVQIHQPLKQIQSLKQLNFISNQYVLSPPSPALHFQPRPAQEKKNMKTLNFIPSGYEEVQVNGRQCTRLPVNHKNLVIFNDNKQQQRAKQINFNTHSPSAKNHHLTPFLQTNYINPQNAFQIQRMSPKHSNNYLSFEGINQPKSRPHSHNPFSSKHFIKEQTILQANEPQKYENRKSRAISSSPNIKISYIASQPTTPNPHKPILKPNVNDYEADSINHNNKIHKIGTLQNKQIRKTYQINSFQNQLIGQPQDQFRNLPAANYAFSSPVSPKVVPNIFQMQSFKVSPPSPTTHFALKTPQHYKQQKSKPSFRMQPSDYYSQKRDKLMVISSNKRK